MTNLMDRFENSVLEVPGAPERVAEIEKELRIKVRRPRRGREEACAVAIAARRLDEIKPAWANLISTRYLNLTSSTRCILGQIYGGFSSGVDRYGKSTEPNGISVFIGNGERQRHYLTKAWKREIRARR